jgi:hypothetical protein
LATLLSKGEVPSISIVLWHSLVSIESTIVVPEEGPAIDQVVLLVEAPNGAKVSAMHAVTSLRTCRAGFCVDWSVLFCGFSCRGGLIGIQQLRPAIPLNDPP